MTCPQCGAPLYLDDATTTVVWWLPGDRLEPRATHVTVRACSGCEYVDTNAPAAPTR